MKAQKKITAIIPAYNEEARIGETIVSMRKYWPDEVIVVNDGSTDNTAEVVAKYPVTLLNLTKNCGKGKAVKEGFKISTGDIILLLDADLGRTASKLQKLIDPVLNDEVEVAIAVLPIKGGGLGFVRKLAEYVLRYFTGKKMLAPLSGQRVLTRKVFDDITLLPDDFGLELAMDIALLKANINFLEIKLDLDHHITGHSIKGYLHRSKQFLSILNLYWQMRKI